MIVVEYSKNFNSKTPTVVDRKCFLYLTPSGLNLCLFVHISVPWGSHNST